MITSSKTVNEFTIEYGEVGYKVVADHLKGYLKVLNQLEAAKRQMASTKRLGGIGGEELGSASKAAMQEQQRLIAGLREELKLRKEVITAQEKELNFRHKLEAATPFGRFMNQWEKLGQVFRRVADALLSFLVINTIRSALQGFFGGIIQANSLLQNLETRLNAVNKGKDGSFSELIDHIVMLTVKTPYMIKEFTDAAITLQAYGLSAKKNLGPIADWAAALGRDLGDVSTAFAKVASGSPRTALLLSTRGISKKEFDEELKTTHDRTQALVNIIERQFGGLAFKVSRTFDGMVSNLKDAWFLLSKEMGAPIFRELNKDVETLYFSVLSLAKGAKEGSTAVKVFGESLAALYNMLKFIIPTIVLLGGITGIHKLRVGFLGAVEAMGKFSKILPMITLGTAVLIAPIVELTARQIELNAVTTKYNEATQLRKKLEEDRADNTRGYVDAIEAQIQAQQQLLELNRPGAVLWDQRGFNPRFSLGAVMGQIPGFLKSGMNVSYAVELAKEYEIRQKYVEQLEGERRTRIAILEIKEAERELNKEMHGTEIQALNEEMGKRQEGLNYMTKLRDTLKEIVDAESGRFKGATKSNAATFLADWGERFKQFWNMQKALDVLNRTIKFDVNAEGARAVSEAFDSIDEVLKTIANNGLSPDMAMELLKSLPEKPTARAAKEFTDRTAQIAELRAQLEELRKGESTLFANITGNKAEEKIVQKEIDDLEAGGLNTLKKKYEWQGKVIQLLKAQIAIFKDQKTYDEKLADAQLKIVEQRRGYVKALEANISGELQRQYEKTADIAYYYQDINDSVAELKDRLAEVTEERDNQYALGEKDKVDKALYKEHLAAAIGLDKERLQLIEAIADAEHKLWTGPSQDFLFGLEKAVIRIRQDLNKMWDDLAEMTFDSIREFGSFALSTLLFGDPNDKSAETIAQYTMELQQLYADASRTAYEMGQIKRREGETNEAYLARTQMLEEIQQTQAQTYILKTKEMEIMEKINAAERERSDIILQRLQQIAGKMSDKIMDTLMNMLISGGMRLFGGGSTEIVPPGGGWNDIGSGGSPVSPGGGGRLSKSGISSGISVVITGNQIFGQDDFNGMVDMAIKKISDRRSR